MYSQNQEEEHILRYFEGQGPLRFLDVGAWDGKTFSNTYALGELGWEGVLVEPGLEGFRGLVKNCGANPRLQLIHAALGQTKTLAKLWNTADALSTTDPKNHEAWEAFTDFNCEFWVPQITWDDIAFQFGGFQFVNIDTEGTSGALFVNMLQTKEPELICVEHDGHAVELTGHAEAKGYKIVHLNGENVIFGK